PVTGDGAGRRLEERYREVVAEFAVTGVPPVEIASWLMKPAALVRGTWDGPEDAGGWLATRLAEGPYPERADRLVRDAVERLAWGGDVSLGFYLDGTLFRSIAVVTCSPNRARPEFHCPLAR
ncbi:hypothetical protein, partial [Streptomyces sp. NPDC058953]